LRKVEEKCEDERHHGGSAGSPSGGVGGLFDVGMILEMRRRVLECEDNDSDGVADDDDDIWD